MSNRRLVWIGIELMALMGLVVFASLSYSITGSRSSTPPPTIRVIAQTITLLVVASDLAIVALIAYGLWPGRRRRKESYEEERSSYQPSIHWIWKVLAASLPLLAVIALVLVGHAISTHLRPTSEIGFPVGGFRSMKNPRVAGTGGALPGFDTPALLAAGGITGLTIITLWVTRRRPHHKFEPQLRRDLSGSIDSSLEDIRRERDPRRAVVIAYARMERVLGTHGLPRWDYEVPFEYLSRVLGELRVRPEAISNLTDLFELATFSQHDIDIPMKEQAISSLVAVRNDLDTAT